MSDFPAGLGREDIEFVLKHDNEVVSVERLHDRKAIWRISYAPEGRGPVQVILDNGINEIYLQALIPIDSDHIVEALSTVQPYATVGLTLFDETLFMRSSFFPAHSTIHALTNSYRGLALAYLRYREVIS
jgi:hypothetical protein